MWADSFLRSEQRHVLLLMSWGACTVSSATAVAVILAAQRRRSPLLAQFAIQLAVWGVVAAIVAAIEWHGLHLRELAGATRVERFMWLRIGFDLGIIGMGSLLVGAGRWLAASPRATGAGMAIVVHGLALFAIDAQFASSISR